MLYQKGENKMGEVTKREEMVEKKME